MKFLKGLALSLLGFLLFLSLSVSASAFTLNSTILNPDFLTSELGEFDVSLLTEEIISAGPAQAELPEEMMVALVDTIAKFEPIVKEQISAATHSIYDYLLGKKQNPELAITLGDTFLSSDFVIKLLNELDMSTLAEDFISEQIPEEELRVAVINTITELEPQIKERVGLAADPIFDYLLGESQSLDLALILHDIVLTPDLVTSIVAKLDLSSQVRELLIQQLTEGIPEEMGELTQYAEDAITEEWVEAQLNSAIPSILDYLLGQSQTLRVSISLQSVKENLRESLREAFLESPPPEFAGVPRALLEQYFDDFFQELIGSIPSTFELDESLLSDLRTQITGALAEAEAGLAEARQNITKAIAETEVGLEEARRYIGYFQLGYKLLIGFILLLILGIVLINRQIREATRRLGSIFLSFAIPACIGLFAIRYFAEIQTWILQLLKIDIDIPAQFQALILQTMNNFLAPVRMLCLGLLIVGVALIVVSFVYKPRQSEL